MVAGLRKSTPARPRTTSKEGRVRSVQRAGRSGAATCAPTHDQQGRSRAQCADVSTVCTRRECDATISAVQIAEMMTMVIAPLGPSRLGSQGLCRAAPPSGSASARAPPRC